MNKGDVFLCYLVRLSRWCGALRIDSDAYEDATPIYGDPDPFVIRFKVSPMVTLDPERAVPIFEPTIWDHLSETKGSEIGSSGWTGYFRSSLRQIADPDGELLLRLLKEQQDRQTIYAYNARDRRQLG